MKILHVAPTYLPAYRYGGPIHSVHGLNKYLVRAGAEVSVYTTAIDGKNNLEVPLNLPSFLDGVEITYFQPGHPRSWFYSSQMSHSLRAQAADFDLIHATSVFLSASYLAARAAVRFSKPLVISPHGSLMRQPLARKSPLKKKIYLSCVERRNLSQAAAIHFASEKEREEYEAVGLPARRQIVIPNGLDPETLPPGDPVEFRKKLGIDKDNKVILFLGRLSWEKGLDTLLPAFSLVAEQAPEAVLVIAGGDDENYSRKLHELMEASGQSKKIFLTGPLGGPERSAAYQAADVFALSSYTENFALTALESMFFGVPPVVTPEVGLASDISAAGAGLVAPKNPEDFAEALLKIIKNKELARKMSVTSKGLAANFSYEKIAANFMEIYQELALTKTQVG